MASGPSQQPGILVQFKDAASTIIGQLWKNVEKLPGWVPLLIGYQLILAPTKEDARFLGIPIKPNIALFVGILTYLSYQVGDAIDKPLFKYFEDSLLDKTLGWVVGVRKKRKDLRDNDHFKAGEGIYRVAIGLLTTAEEYKTPVHLCNEIAKFFRSAVIPLVVLPYILPSSLSSIRLVWRAIFAVILFVAYLFFKPLHMRLLYGNTSQLIQDGQKYNTVDVENNIRLYFWDGRLAASAKRSL